MSDDNLRLKLTQDLYRTWRFDKFKRRYVIAKVPLFISLNLNKVGLGANFRALN